MILIGNWANSIVEMINRSEDPSKICDRISEILESGFLLEVVKDSRSLIETVSKIMDILVEFFYYEQELQVIWLGKLGIVEALRDCQPACKSLPSYVYLLQNMMCLTKSELAEVGCEIFEKIQKSEISSNIIANFLQSEQVQLKTEGICFFGKYINNIATFNDDGMLLMKLILEENLLTVLSQ